MRCTVAAYPYSKVIVSFSKMKRQQTSKPRAVTLVQRQEWKQTCANCPAKAGFRGCQLSENLRQTREQEEESRRSSTLRIPLESTAIYFWFSTLACSAAKSRLTVFTRFLKVRRDSETKRQVFLLLFADVHKACFAGRAPKRRLWHSPRSPRLVWLAICGVQQEICPKH